MLKHSQHLQSHAETHLKFQKRWLHLLDEMFAFHMKYPRLSNNQNTHVVQLKKTLVNDKKLGKLLNNSVLCCVAEAQYKTKYKILNLN